MFTVYLIGAIIVGICVILSDLGNEVNIFTSLLDGILCALTWPVGVLLFIFNLFAD